MILNLIEAVYNFILVNINMQYKLVILIILLILLFHIRLKNRNINSENNYRNHLKEHFTSSKPEIF